MAIPVLVALFPEMRPHQLVATSFGFILINASINISYFWRAGLRPQKRLVLSMGVGVALGVPLGAQILGLLNPRSFEILFGLMLILLAGRNQFSQTPDDATEAEIAKRHGVSLVHTGLGLIIGIVAGLTGIGGGTLILPVLMVSTSLPLKAISFHSHLVMLFAAGSGIALALLGPLSDVPTGFAPLGPNLGPIALLPLAILSLGSYFSASRGSQLLARMSPVRLRLLFTCFLLLIGLSFLFP